MASEQYASEPPEDPASRTDGSGTHSRPSTLREGIHAHLEEMRFSSGVVLMATAGAFVIVVVVGLALALGGGSDAGTPPAGAPAVTKPTSASARPTHHSPRAHGSSRRPNTSSSTTVGTTSPSPTPRPTASPTPSGPPSWSPKVTDPCGKPHWHHASPPPWCRHH